MRHPEATGANADVESALHAVVAGGPTETLPSVRCMRTKSLEGALREALNAQQPGRHSGRRALKRLVEHRLARPVFVQRPKEDRPSSEFYEVGLHDLGPIGAFELLMAWNPAGVLAYASAITLHELSTQRLPIAHLVVLKEPRPPTAVPPPASAGRSTRSHDPHGQLAFVRDGIRHYESTRSLPIARTQEIQLHELARGRVTSIAQTLLDCLRKPLPCGGVSVIFEAWETGWPRCSEKALVAVLDAWRWPDVDLRRIGWLATALQLDLPPQLAEHCERARKVPDAWEAPLFAGLTFERRDEDWKLLVP